MISVPEGFDVATWIAELISAVVPLAPLVLMGAVAVVLKRAMRG